MKTHFFPLTAIAALMTVLIAATAFTEAEPQKQKRGVRFNPVIKTIEGWKVHVDPAMLKGKHAAAGEKAAGSSPKAKRH